MVLKYWFFDTLVKILFVRFTDVNFWEYSRRYLRKVFTDRFEVVFLKVLFRLSVLEVCALEW